MKGTSLRRGAFLSVLGIALAYLPACSGPQSEDAPRPNILFVFADDHAYQAISAYGSKINKTPNIDRLAKEGMRFDRCVVTNSICAPSRAVILTGKYSHLNGVLDNRIEFDGGQQTFPKLLQQAGYQTAVVGKWHLKSAPTGFDFWEVLPGQGDYYNPEMLYVERTEVRAGETVQIEGRRQIEGYTTDVITDLALDWLQSKRDAQKPFMLMMQHKAPHRNWMPGPNHLTMYDGQTIPEPETLFDDYSNRASPAANQQMEIGRHMNLAIDLKVPPAMTGDNDAQTHAAYQRMVQRLTPAQRAAWDKAYTEKNRNFADGKLEGQDLVRWKYQRYVKDYLRSIASVDDNLGRMFDYLDESGLAENTIVIYSSDQGFYLGEHGWFDKRWMYEESFRTPLIVRWPGVAQPGSVNSQIVSNLDFAQTFLEVAGVTPPADMQGRSLLALLKSEPPDEWRNSIYYHYYESMLYHGVPEHYGVATDRYKLIHYPETNEWELFDLETDPQELRSRHGDREYADVRQDLFAELERLRMNLKLSPAVQLEK
jgi:arylsulfatase A-like enzyme